LENISKPPRKKLAILDIAHEWGYLEEIALGFTKEVKVLIRDAIEELQDHVAIIVDTQKAHIDVLEIKNSRQFGLLAFVVSIVVSYAAVWEFFVRDIVTGIQFPSGLCPDLNFALSIVALIPIFAVVIWGWCSYFWIRNENNQRRTFTRSDGNIGVELRKERVIVTDAYLACQGLLADLTEAELKARQENIDRYETGQ